MIELVLISRYRFKGAWTPLSGLIKLATNCKYHHCLFIVDGYCYEAVPKGVLKTISKEEFESKVGIHYDVLRTDVTHLFDNIKFNERIGNKYDYTALFLHLLNQMCFGWIERKPRPSDKDTCGSFCAYVLGYFEYWKVDPQDLYRDFFQRKG